MLLEQIKAEKDRLVKEKKIKKEKPLPAITEDEMPYELPKGWEWCRLGEIGSINPRNSLQDKIEASFVPMTLISEKYGILPQYEVREWGEIKSGFTHFAENDVVVAKITPCFENSKAAVMRELKNGVGAGTTELHVFRGNLHYILPDFVYVYFKTPRFLSEGKAKMTGSAGQKRVPKNYIIENPFPLPPLAEQKAIVEKVDQLMKLCDTLEAQVKKAKEKEEHLMQALIQDVFEDEEEVPEAGQLCFNL